MWSVWAYSRFRVPVDTQGARTRALVVQAVAGHANDLLPREIGLLLYALGKLGVPANDLPEVVRDKLHAFLSR